MARDGDEAGAVLRGGDAALVAQVRRLAELAGVPLAVAGPDDPAPGSALVLTADGPPGRLSVRADPARTAGPPGGAPSAVVLPAEAEALLDLLVAAASRQRARVVGVLGAHGGAGASVLAAALARAVVATGAATALVDLDPAGGVDVLLGLEHDPGQRWGDLDGEHALLPQRLALALPDWHLVRVLSGDRRGGPPEEAVALSAVRALGQGHDLLVLDLPRQVLGPGPDRDLWLGWCADVVLVARGGVRGAAAVVAAAPTLAGRARPHLVVRGGEPAAAAEVAGAAGLELAAHMRDERALPAGIEHGVAPGDQRRGHLRATARLLLDQLGVGR
ncbi:hypothetical protein [Georgenia ruanii]|uniref:hypothetical protein n=1 Tax=Georgenia ruanii TaxID=348442 RepID=UPI001263F345|nr:hypothetical protein [Georgenia ruanii]